MGLTMKSASLTPTITSPILDAIIRAKVGLLGASGM